MFVVHRDSLRVVPQPKPLAKNKKKKRRQRRQYDGNLTPTPANTRRAFSKNT